MQQRAFIAVLLAATMAGSSGVFIKYLEIPATSISFIRTAVPSVLLGAWMLIQGIPFLRGNYKLMLGVSALNAFRMYCFFTAYIYTSIANAVIISYTWPIFATLFSVLFLKEQISKRNLFLLFMAFTGIIVVYANKPISFENNDFIGMTAALAAAMAHAISVVVFKKEADNYTSTEILFFQNIVSVFVFFPFILMNEPTPTTADLTIATSHAIFLGIIAFSFFFYGLKRLNASTASALTYIEIVSALLFSIFWMHEIITPNMVVGGGIIIASTGLIRR